MEHSSEYQFPIFISSTEYNLLDLRSELANYLSTLGYRPILSSATGFPDRSPILEPWESCLPVLDTCFVVILIIDGRYGASLEWPNFQEIFEGKKLSPTHGEYIFAKRRKKRTIVFVRKELITYYESFRNLKKNIRSDEDLKAELKKFLPDRIDPNALFMLSQIKTEKPIPWITEFDTITDLKYKLQKKLLNELAELFQLKDARLETLIQAFYEATRDLPEERQCEIFKRFEYVQSAKKLELELDEHKASIEKLRSEIEQNKADKEKTKELQAKITALTKQLEKKEKEKTSTKSSPVEYVGNRLNEAISGVNVLGTTVSDIPISTFSSQVSSHGLLYVTKKKCSKCGSEFDNTHLSSLVSSMSLRHCNDCGRDLCSACWPYTVGSLAFGKCPDCSSKQSFLRSY